MAGQQGGQIGPVAQGLSSDLGFQGGQFLSGLQNASQNFAPGALTSIGGLLGIGGGQGGLSQQLQGLAGQGGSPALQALAQGGGGLDFQQLLEPGPQLEGQLGALQTAIQRNLAGTLGTTGRQASVAGQAGGDREAFFAREAGQEAQTAFAGGAADLFASDLAQRRGLAATAAQFQLGQQQNVIQANIAQQGQRGLSADILGGLLGTQTGAFGAAGNLGLAQQQSGTQAGLGGLGALGGLFNLGLAPFGAQFQPLQALAGILGSPSILSESGSFGLSQGTSGGFGLSVLGG